MKKRFTHVCIFLSFSFIYHSKSFGQHEIPSSSTLRATISGASVKEVATRQINAYNVIRSGSVSYTAGETIILEHGFQVADGAEFNAQIESVKEFDQITGSEVDSDITQLELNAYPNPFSDNTQVEYRLPKESKVKLAVYDIKGVQVALLIDNKIQPKGVHKATFESKHLPSGIYSCIVATPDSKKVHKVFKH